MKGLDTNILVRYLVQDDEQQAAVATRLISQHCTENSPGFINRIVVCELVWVLESAYQYSRQLIGEILDKLFRTKQLAFEDLSECVRALHVYRSTSVDFADALIALINRAHGCDETFSFDKKASRIDGVSLQV